MSPPSIYKTGGEWSKTGNLAKDGNRNLIAAQEKPNNTLFASSSVKYHLVILQMTELLCWTLSLARP